MANLDDIANINEDLKALPLPDGVNKLVPGAGDVGSRVVFIGHSPSGADNDTGNPYTGPAGDLLEELMGEADMKRSDIYLTNLVKVWTWKDERGQKVNRTPTVKEIKAYLPYLQRELETIKPVALVCLGGTAAQFFLGKDFKITSEGGKWFEIPETSPYCKAGGRLPEPNPKVMGMAQPSYLIHLQDNAPESYSRARNFLIDVLRDVKKVLEGEEPGVNDTNNEDEVPF
ncbi:MAG: uracil-DNA glycosylase [Trueperaceae bacterium]